MMSEQLFDLGQIVATPGALAALEGTDEAPMDFIKRHASGDWGCAHEDDKELNDDAIWDGTRIFSVYVTKNDETLYCITEADRSSTCLLLAEEY
ncbi:hypothetical protein SV7mr_19380 [Stieleria bergensis]|uniref:Type I restriction endonuclease subunit M n=1 Tax=Stieleria bergensis TaxID=2528025 RepID=A0A517STH9_9BACT|nr:hypothetical protein SV7mr_19380 [Planctomycetes bacterium SV_7m_r]